MLTATACLLGIAATIVCLAAWWRMRATTLAAPCAWCAASLLAVTGEVVSPAFIEADPRGAAHFQYLAAITTLAPFVALLGAKRPQNGAWQLIVASLLALLAFQDLKNWSIDPAVGPAPHAAWRWLMAVLVLMQLLNYLATRYSVPAFLAAAGQACLLGAFLPFLSEQLAGLAPLGLCLASLAVLSAAFIDRCRGRSHDDWHNAWLDFRDRYGALWALRVAERVNAIAAQQHYSQRLEWRGFRPVKAAEAPPATEIDPIYKSFQAILARFTSARPG